MDTDRLRYFLTVARTGSLAEAARLLHVSPAALSKSLKVLEDELHQTLAVRQGRGLVITDQGRRVAERAAAILENIRDLSEEVPRTSPQRLRIASFEVFTTYFLPRALLDGWEGVGVDVLELTPGKMEEALLENLADIALTYLPMPHPDLEALPIAPVKMGVYGLKKFQGVCVSDLPFAAPILPLTGSPNRVNGLDGWPEAERPRRVVYRVALLETALELCLEGLAVAYVPHFLVNLQNARLKPEYGLVDLGVAPDGAKAITAYLVKRRCEAESPWLKRLAKELRRALR